MIIELDNVVTLYEGANTPTISNINLKVKQGEFIGVIGPNAVGKTTLLETINGVLKASKGSVKVFGKDVSKNGHDVRKDIGYLPQEVSFDGESPFLVRDVVLMGRYGAMGILKSPKQRDYELVSNALSRIGILHLADRPIGKLSGGELQKVMFARTVAKTPKVMLLDEPFNNLDMGAREELVEILSKIHRDMNLTTLMIIHEIDYLSKIDVCNRVVLMRDGTIAEDATPTKILKSKTLVESFRRDH